MDPEIRPFALSASLPKFAGKTRRRVAGPLDGDDSRPRYLSCAWFFLGFTWPVFLPYGSPGEGWKEGKRGLAEGQEGGSGRGELIVVPVAKSVSFSFLFLYCF